MIIVLVLSIVLILIDQILKVLICNKIAVGESVVLIKNFFHITRAHNYGAAWSILNEQSIFLIVIAVIAIVIVYFYFIKDKKLKKSDTILYSMLISGILGNMIDRIRLGYVVDYLDFYIFGYDYPVFNLADILIVISMTILIIKTFKEDHDAKVQSRSEWSRHAFR